jgi:hypothetical protein
MVLDFSFPQLHLTPNDVVLLCIPIAWTQLFPPTQTFMLSHTMSKSTVLQPTMEKGYNEMCHTPTSQAYYTTKPCNLCTLTDGLSFLTPVIKQYHVWGGYVLVSNREGLCSTPDQSTWHYWWTSGDGTGFLPSTCLPFQYQSTLHTQTSRTTDNTLET